ncbi:MAG: PD-(D/E)XK nuclease family protein [Peptoniphilaceae bacterium]|nr:PD-(D/E)XK nuclease family protein [Peptoniphilaceae bacterium]MDY3076308.1 PD-(D/E)XK nuclease family protein [Peptoniphilaceae bacterium]MDY5841882.1 PD-(D/E)XK nuclease family protein [Peptoniphilaceae bacterium]
MLMIHVDRDPGRATNSLLPYICESLKNGKTARYLVPGQFTVEAEQLLFDKLNTEILLNLKVQSLPSLAGEILQQTSGYSRLSIDAAGRRILLRSILEKLTDSGKLKGERFQKKGTVEALFSDIREYKEYGIAPELFDALANRLTDAPSTQEKLRHIAEIYRAYEASMDRFEDSDERMKRAFSQIPEIQELKNSDFFFDYFHSVSKLELEAIRNLIVSGSSVHIALPLDVQIARFIQQNQTMPRSLLLTQAQEIVSDGMAFSHSMAFLLQLLEIFPSAKILANPKKNTSAMAIAASAPFRLHSMEKSALPVSNGTVHLIQYRNTEQEVDALIVEIRRLLQRKAARYRDIQVLLTEPDEYRGFIERKFGKEQIPFFMDETRTPDYHPFIQLIRNSLSIVSEGFSPGSVFTLLRTGFFDLEEADIDTYENYILRRRIRYSMFEQKRYFEPDREFLSKHPREAAEWERETLTAGKVNDVLLSVLSPLLLCRKKRNTMSEFCRIFYDYLMQEPVRNGLQRYAQVLEDENRREQLREHQQIWGACMNLLDELVSIVGDEEGEFKAFQRYLEEGLSALSLGVIPPYQDQITISDLKRGRSRGHRFVFLLGMSDLWLPSSKKSAGLLTAEEKQFFAEENIRMPSMPTFAVTEERLAFYTAICRAQEELFLFCSLQTRNNEPASPSYWMKKIEEAFADVTMISFDHFTPEDLFLSRTLRMRLLPDYIRSEQKEALGKALLAQFRQIPEMQREVRMIEAVTNYTNIRKPLSEAVVQQLYPKTTVSPSGLEMLSACPYRYFASSGLGVRVRSDWPVDAAEIGSLMHGAIDLWTREIAGLLSKENVEISPDRSLAIAEEAFEKTLSGVLDQERRSDPRNAFLMMLTKKTMHEAQSALVRQLNQSHVRGLAHELAFGYPVTKSGILLPTDTRTLEIVGRIDRVDTFQTPDHRKFVQVIDYKTGNRSFSLSEALYGIHLQLPLYLMAASDTMSQLPAGAFYAPIQAPRVLDANETEKAEEWSLKEHLLDGFLLRDTALNQEMDPAFGENPEGEKMFSPIYELKGAKYSLSDRENLLAPQEMDRLLESAYLAAKRSAGIRESGIIAPRPYRYEQGSRVQTACDYCPYRPACRFEKQTQYKSYRFLSDIQWKDWREMQEGEK